MAVDETPFGGDEAGRPGAGSSEEERPTVAELQARGDALVAELRAERLSRDGMHKRLVAAGFTYDEASCLLDGMPLGPRGDPAGGAGAGVTFSIPFLLCLLATLAVVVAISLNPPVDDGPGRAPTAVPLVIVFTLFTLVLGTFVVMFLLHLFRVRWRHPFTIVYCAWSVLVVAGLSVPEEWRREAGGYGPTEQRAVQAALAELLDGRTETAEQAARRTAARLEEIGAAHGSEARALLAVLVEQLRALRRLDAEYQEALGAFASAGGPSPHTMSSAIEIDTRLELLERAERAATALADLNARMPAQLDQRLAEAGVALRARLRHVQGTHRNAPEREALWRAASMRAEAIQSELSVLREAWDRWTLDGDGGVTFSDPATADRYEEAAERSLSATKVLDGLRNAFLLSGKEAALGDG